MALGTEVEGVYRSADDMKFIAKRLLALGLLFLLSPVWTFPFIHEIALRRVENWENASGFSLSLLGFDDMLFQTEFMSYLYLFRIGFWITAFAIILHCSLWLVEKMEVRRAQITK